MSALFVSSAFAQQKNELAVSYGRTFISHQTVPGTSTAIAFGHGHTFNINYARHLKSGDFASLSVEIPVVFNPDEDINYPSNVIPGNYSSYFVTPSARITFFPNVPVTPWASLGGGFGHFGQSSTLEFGGSNPTSGGTSTGVLQVGAGIDVKTWRSFSLRGEFRDFDSGVPHFPIKTSKSRQHNLFVGVGVVWSFGR